METLAIINAITGKNGKKGVLKGRCNSGAVFLKTSTDIMAKIYSAMAPKQAMVIMSPVLPVSNAMMPIPVFNNNACTGVLKVRCTLPNMD